MSTVGPTAEERHALGGFERADLRRQLAVVIALVRRALNEITRVPGASIPGVLAPTIFVIGLSSVFGQADQVPGFGAVDFKTFVVPVGFLQAAGFTGAATGVNLARDIEQGWFDRLLLCPAPRLTVLAGVVASAALRCLLPVSFLFAVAMTIGVDFPGIGGLLIALLLIMGLASAFACYAVTLALRFRTQQAAPLMQMGSFVGVLFTPAYVPKELLAGWLEAVATVNPVTQVLIGVRQSFVGETSWGETWPALLAVAGLILLFGAFAARGLRRYAS
ncbi:MAG: ABC transporter permease [Solirubrobacterales bacterium]|nr:ABC transporter permease [Solirubrobacterales bacterium]